MCFKKCCFFLPLNIGCVIIGGIFLSYHTGELITHTDNTIFLWDVAKKKWAPLILAPMLVCGIISCILLIYAACKGKRGFVLVWLIIHIPILVIFVILTIYDSVTTTVRLAVVIVQVVIDVVLLASVLIVNSYYNYLAVHPDDFYD